MKEVKIEPLKQYFNKRQDVVMAFLFGSFVDKKQTRDSDIDIAVYFKLLSKMIEWEEKRDYPQEDEIWADLVDILGTDNVDLVVLNRVNPVLASNILENGLPLVIKDINTYWNFYEIISMEAEDFYQFAEEYWQIYKTAKSLLPQQRVRLIARVQFLDIELQELPLYKNLTFDTYCKDKVQRRNIERWVENIINATIDIAKIILASEKKQMPKSYREVLLNFGLFSGLNEEEAKRFSEFSKLRNILAHEYLDIVYEKIQSFLKISPPIYKKLIDFLKQYLDTTKT